MPVHRDNTVDTAERSALALVIVDMINPLAFDGAAALRPAAEAAAARIAALKQALRAREQPVIYANDNFGRWRSDFRQVVARCRDSGGRRLVEQLAPDAQDYFVLKPKQSAFHATPLGLLLAQLGVRKLLLTGVASDGCVLATAFDAHLRDYALHVPADCVAAQSEARQRRALALIAETLGGCTDPAEAVLSRWPVQGAEGRPDHRPVEGEPDA